MIRKNNDQEEYEIKNVCLKSKNLENINTKRIDEIKCYHYIV